MNLRLGVALAAAWLAFSGCATSGDSERPAGAGVGTMTVRRSGDGSLFSAAARAWFCAADSVLSIAAVGTNWTAAIALRSPWPPADSQYAIGSNFGAGDSARLALRPLPGRDSVGFAFTGRSGRVRLRGGTPLSGQFAAVVRADKDSLRVEGRFDGITVDRNGCAAVLPVPTRPGS